MNKTSISRSPWWWVPTLYFAEGIPYFIVNNISVTMFTRMGVPNGEMALFTSLLYLPWTLKPLWSPAVDILKTKRWWILAMQILMSISFIFLIFSIPHPLPEMMASSRTPIGMFTFTLILFTLTAFASATHDIAADGFYMIALDQGQQSFFVGIRSTFYRLSSIFGQGVLVVIAGLLEKRTGNIPLAWTLTMAVTAVIFAAVTLYHTFAIPSPSGDRTVRSGGENSTFASGFGNAFITFFKKPGALIAIVFMLLYRLPEAFLLKMVNPFLLSSAEQGGLALSTSTVGVIYGTIGVIALTVGGIAGGMAASKWGLKKSLWPMAALMTLPCLTFVYLSMAMPHNLLVISVCVAVEQFGYGFGFTAYMLYMMYFSEGEYKTSHYAICTAFMALSMMIPGAFAGYLQEMMGYRLFFWMVIVCCLGTVAVTKMIKVENES
ncbi:MAG: MFS transporter [Candidatus Cryptobacteroides sp.]